MNFDLVIRNATVMPGDGPGVPADVGVAGDRIAAVAPTLHPEGSRRVMDATGLLLCPGFIDMHAHSALSPFHDPLQTAKIAQGFTTEVIHPDGLAPAPVTPDRAGERRAYLQALEGSGPDPWPWRTFAEYLRALAEARPATTLVPSAGHNAARDYVLGSARRAPGAEELAEMRRQVRLMLEAGGRTLSFGLIYLPGLYAETEELVAVAEEAAAFGAPLVPHMRSESDHVLEAAREMIGVARRAGTPLHISHLKVIGNPHLVDGLLGLLDQARADGIDVSFDQYPYGAGSTTLAALLPPWALEGGTEAILRRLGDRGLRVRMARDIEGALTGWENFYRSCGPEGVFIADAAEPWASAAGRSLAAIGAERGMDPLQAALQILWDTGLKATMIDHYASEEVVRTIFRHPAALVGSDGIFGARPHPRLYATAARVLGRYALREHVIPVEDAVARLTARAADRLALSDRGRIREGLRADLVLLDPAQYVDTATYEDPKQHPPGVRAVFVAGRAAWEDGRPTGVRAGQVIQTPRPGR
jgi:N-acyl-D-amino-acid deacylase